MPDPSHPYDIVLVGATGFTGGLTARYLSNHAPTGCRWAIAGRRAEQLEALAAELAGGNGPHGCIVVDLTDPVSVAELVTSTRVVATTVGPYLEHGGPLVAACAAAGTDYLDITGEPEFVDRAFVAHHAEALASGARLIHCCGFDSIPHDLGALHAVLQLPEDQAIELDGYVRAGGRPSGGTFASALNVFGRLGPCRGTGPTSPIATRSRSTTSRPPSGSPSASRRWSARPRSGRCVGR